MSSTRLMKAFLVTALGACTFAARSAHATTAFLWSGAVPSLFLAASHGLQLFVTEKLDIECALLEMDGTLSTKTTAGIRSRGEFSGCETTSGVRVSSAVTEFEWIATSGIKLRDFIAFEVGAAICTIDFLPELGAERKTVSYSNTTSAVLALANATGFEYNVLGGEGKCGKTEGTHTDGKYHGLVLLSLDEAGGTFKWDS